MVMKKSSYKVEKGTWIYWRWKNKDNHRTFAKSHVQDIIEGTLEGDLLELSDNSFGTEYPTRILLKEIQII